MVNLVIGLVCPPVRLAVRPAVRTHISVTARWTFLILGTKMCYGLGMMPGIFLIRSVISDPQTKMPVSKIGSNGNGSRLLSSNLTWALFTHVALYIGLVLAAHMVKSVDLRNALFLYIPGIYAW